jgi:hypothetical protein
MLLAALQVLQCSWYIPGPVNGITLSSACRLSPAVCCLLPPVSRLLSARIPITMTMTMTITISPRGRSWPGSDRPWRSHRHLWCHSGVTVVLQWCYSGVMALLNHYRSGVTVVSQCCLPSQLALRAARRALESRRGPHLCVEMVLI